jgi:hypothetical protein
VQQNHPSLHHLVGADKQRRWHGDADDVLVVDHVTSSIGRPIQPPTLLSPKPLDLRLERLWQPPPHPETGAALPVEKQKIAAGAALDRDVLDQLREDLGGTAALRQVIRSFLDQTPSVLSALRDAAARADVPSIRRAALPPDCRR